MAYRMNVMCVFSTIAYVFCFVYFQPETASVPQRASVMGVDVVTSVIPVPTSVAARSHARVEVDFKFECNTCTVKFRV